MSQTHGYISVTLPNPADGQRAVGIAHTQTGTAIVSADEFKGNIDNHGADIPIIITLPALASVQGRICRIAQVNVNTVTIQVKLEEQNKILYNGMVHSLVKLPGKGSAVVLRSDGTWWHVELAAAVALDEPYVAPVAEEQAPDPEPAPEIIIITLPDLVTE